MIALFFEIVIIAVVVWAVNSIDQIPPPFKKIILVLGIVLALFVIAQAFGFMPHDIAIPHAR